MPSITVSGSIDPLLSVVLNKGESIFAERNAMVSMDATLALTGRAKGGFFSALSRKVLNDESFFSAKDRSGRRSGRSAAHADSAWRHCRVANGRASIHDRRRRLFGQHRGC